MGRVILINSFQILRSSIPHSPGLKLDQSPGDMKRGKVATIPDQLYQEGCVSDAKHGMKVAEKIGYPVMIKASEGGGGKGIRKARNSEEFPSLFYQVHSLIPSTPYCHSDTMSW